MSDKKSIHHSFDTELASKYGVDEAILIHHFQYWISHNARLKRNLHKGSTWMYQTLEEIAAHFPYWTADKVYEIIEKLCTGKNRRSKRDDLDFAPVLKKGNFNNSKYDRTAWYAFIDEPNWISANAKMENGECQNQDRQMPTPIPDTKTDPIPDAKTENISCPKPETDNRTVAFEVAEELWRRVLAIHPKAKPPKLDLWTKDIEKAMRIDKRSKEDLMEVIRYAFEDDPFWCKVLQSAEKLRANFDKIWMKKSPVDNKGSRISINMEVAREIKQVLISNNEGNVLQLYKNSAVNQNTGDSISYDLPSEKFEEIILRWFKIRKKDEIREVSRGCSEAIAATSTLQHEPDVLR